MILVENLAESFNENFDENFVSFHFDFVIESCYDDADQNFHNIIEFYFFPF